MYQDRHLVPAEAIRLAALGRLKQGNVSYAGLASDIRHVVARIVGPNLDLLGSSLQILRLEGLIEAEDTTVTEVEDDTVLTLTVSGEDAFFSLMSSVLRVPLDETCRLVYFLKLRFLDLLEGEDRLDQIDLLLEYHRGELARLNDLLQSHNEHRQVLSKDFLSVEKQEGEGEEVNSVGAFLTHSLEMDVAYQQARITWLEKIEAQEEAAA